jgi:hypothetical protein
MHGLQQVQFASYYYPLHKHHATLAQSPDYILLPSLQYDNLK